MAHCHAYASLWHAAHLALGALLTPCAACVSSDASADSSVDTVAARGQPDPEAKLRAHTHTQCALPTPCTSPRPTQCHYDTHAVHPPLRCPADPALRVWAQGFFPAQMNIASTKGESEVRRMATHPDCTPHTVCTHHTLCALPTHRVRSPHTVCTPPTPCAHTVCTSPRCRACAPWGGTGYSTSTISCYCP